VLANPIAIVASAFLEMGSVPSQRKSMEVRSVPTMPMAISTASDPTSVDRPSPRTITVE
jgi:hypothetical protein